MTEKKSTGGDEAAAFPRNAEEARADRDLTRQELADTVDELTDRLNVPARARSAMTSGLDQVDARIDTSLPEPAAARARQALVFVRQRPAATAGAVLAAVLLLRRVRRRSNG